MKIHSLARRACITQAAIVVLGSLLVSPPSGDGSYLPVAAEFLRLRTRLLKRQIVSRCPHIRPLPARQSFFETVM